MGNQCSAVEDLSENELLKKLCSTTKIERDDEFWEDFLSFNIEYPTTKSGNEEVKKSVEEHCKQLAENNAKLSGNFSTLVNIFVFYIQEISSDESKLTAYCLGASNRCTNALFVNLHFIEYLSENFDEDVLLQQFNTLPEQEEIKTVAEDFVKALVNVIYAIPVNENTQQLHLLSLQCLLLLLSNQIYDNQIKADGKFHHYLMDSDGVGSVAAQLVRILCHNIIKNEKPSVQQADSSILGWASSWWPLGSKSADPVLDSDSLNPLANHSLLLLLVLLFYFPDEKVGNPYREALFHCKPGRKTDEGPIEAEKDQSFPLNFKRLYSAISRDAHSETMILFLYLLIHKNPSFLKYLLARKDLEIILVPILQVLYTAPEQDAHQIYMALIVLLILTQEDEFNNHVHHMTVSDVKWYKDKNITGISVGSLIVLIILRTIQFNMSKMRDKYLHTNCLASLANMSANFRFLHSHVAQKLITLFNQLMKKHARFLQKVEEDPENEEEKSDLAVLEEIIHMMLEILNSCLCGYLQDNTNLIFSILHSKELFLGLKAYDKFQDIVQNIGTVIAYFSARVEAQIDSSENTAEDIMQIIDAVSSNFPLDQLVKPSNLRFKYIEEEAADEFFIPYVWTLVCRSSFLSWKEECIRLFPTDNLKREEKLS